MSAITSTLKIYKKCQIIPERRIVVESISSYLATLTGTKTVNSFQYIRHALNLDIKVDLSQVTQEFTSEYNYCSIQNGDSTKVVYYFIKKIRQVAQSTILLQLEMDVLNTFEWNKDFAVSPKTEVYREHKDRYIKVTSGGVNSYVPDVDYYSEGIDAPLFRTANSKLQDSKVSQTWYLIYKNRTTPTEGSPAVIDCYCAPAEGVSVKISGDMVFNKYNAPSIYKYICISPNYYSGNTAKLVLNTGPTITLTHSSSYYLGVVILNIAGSNTLSVLVYKYYSDGSTPPEMQYSQWCDYFKFYVNDVEQDHVWTQGRTEGQGYPFNLPSGSDNYEWNVGESIVTLQAFSSLDRTDVLLNKIIALPYFPSDYTMSGTIMNLPSEWDYDNGTGFLKLIDINTKFSHNITSQITDPLRAKLPIRSSAYFADGTRNDKYELKLYHSDFYQVKFVYDSFSYVIQAEKISFLNTSYVQTNFSFGFVHTNTMNSRFLFTGFSNYYWRYIQEDYNAILSVARNNEVVIYNSPYLNYLRTSYNFDVKARDRQIKATETGSTIGLIGSGAGMVMSWASMNPVVAISGTMSAGTSIANNIVNRINSVAQAEENFARKQEEMKIQSVSVAGADDLDLLEYYSDNRASLCIYEVSNRMKALVADLFYYCGYKTNETKIPAVNTRRQFNYLECNLHIVEIYSTLGGKYIPDECINKLKEDYLLGVTFIHYYGLTWDILQESTNLETSIV